MEESIGANAPSIKMGEFRVSGEGVLLRTLLGSCVGLALYDRKQRIGGLAHIVLPNAGGVTDRPGKFADTAVPCLITDLETLANNRLNLVAKIAGGASMFATKSKTNIGELNVQACKMLLRENGIPIRGIHCGGTQGRKMTFDPGSGSVWVQIVGQHPTHL